MMHDNADRDVQLENLEELLLDLRGNAALPISAYVEDDDSVTRVLQVPEDTAEWLVAVSVSDQRSLSTEEVRRGLTQGELRADMLVWRRGLPTWQLLGGLPEFRARRASPTTPRVRSSHVEAARPRERRPAPTPVPPQPEAARVPIATCAPEPLLASSPPRVLAPESDRGAAMSADVLVPPEIELDQLSTEGGSLRLKRAVMAVSALAMTAVFVTLFSISSTSEDKVREAARQREAAAAMKAKNPARETSAPARETTAPESTKEDAEDEPPARRRAPRDRAGGLPKAAAAMVIDADERGATGNGAPAGNTDEARQRL